MAYGDGTMRLHRGRWEARVPDGRGGYRYVTGLDRDDVRRRWRDLRKQLRQDPTTSSSRRGGERLDAFLERWLAGTASRRLRPRTLAGHRQVVANHLGPRLGRLRVQDVRLSDVQVVANGLGATHSPQTVRNIVNVLSSAMRQAIREDIIATNPCQHVVLPRATREPLPTLTTEQVRAFLVATRDDHLWPLWALAATTGMRSGELLSLRWVDIDWTARTVTVAGTYRFDGHVYRWEEPKTHRSRRTLPLTDLGHRALKEQLARATSAKLVFARKDGRPYDGTWVLRLFKRSLAAHGLPVVRLHAMRHGAAATMLDMTGGDLRAVSAMLGHASISTTVNVYGGAADEARRRAAAAMDAAMEGLA